MKIFILSFCLLTASYGASAEVTAKEAVKLAIAFAKKDSAHSYGGEVAISEATKLMSTRTEIQLLKLMVNTCDSVNIRQEPICKMIEQDGYFDFEDSFIVKIDYLDCESHSNFIGVEKMTGKVTYLLELSQVY